MGNLLRARYASLVALAAIMVIAPLFLGEGFPLRVVALVWVYGLAAVGLSVLIGQAGQISLGHGAFMGVGTYAVAIGPAHFSVSPLPAALLGLGLSCALAFIVGRPILKLKGYYLSVATLGLGYLLSLFIVNEPALTNGPDGMIVPPIMLGEYQVRGTLTWYWISSVALLAGVGLALNLTSNPTGRAFRALHDSEVAAEVLGIDVGRKKLLAFVLAAGYASIAGSLLGMMNAYAASNVAGFLNSVELVTMVVVGGAGSIIGAVVGAAILTVLPQVLASVHDYELIFIGAVIVLFLIFLPKGIVPSVASKLGVSKS